MASQTMTIARFHRAVFGSNISTASLTYKRLDRIGVKVAKNTALTPALAEKARAAYERYKLENPRYVQRLRSAARAREARRGRDKEEAAPEGKAVPVPKGARELALPLHVVPERTAPMKHYERKPRTADTETQDRQIAVLLLQAAVALLNR